MTEQTEQALTWCTGEADRCLSHRGGRREDLRCERVIGHGGDHVYRRERGTATWEPSHDEIESYLEARLASAEAALREIRDMAGSNTTPKPPILESPAGFGAIYRRAVAHFAAYPPEVKS